MNFLVKNVAVPLAELAPTMIVDAVLIYLSAGAASPMLAAGKTGIKVAGKAVSKSMTEKAITTCVSHFNNALKQPATYANAYNYFIQGFNDRVDGGENAANAAAPALAESLINAMADTLMPGYGASRQQMGLQSLLDGDYSSAINEMLKDYVWQEIKKLPQMLQNLSDKKDGAQF